MAIFSARTRGELALVLSAVLTAGGGLSHLVGEAGWSHQLFLASTIVGILVSAATIIFGLVQKSFRVDIIALLALIGTVLVHEYLAGAVVTLMLLGGRNLEDYATGHAKRELKLLVERAPVSAHVERPGGLFTIPLTEVAPGETIVVASGEVVPLDGELLDDRSVLDESALTGEPMPVEHLRGEPLRSGVVNVSNPFMMVTTSDAQSSTYARIVRLAQEAEAGSAPFVRMADRYALWFLFATLAVSGLAWGFSHEFTRAVAVLVVATPCPLILAAPVAIVSGLSRSARVGVVIKGGAELEKLARSKVLLLDKTGTLTRGAPHVTQVVASPGIDADAVLGFAASLDQRSQHPLATALVSAARERGLVLTQPANVSEIPGQGTSGVIQGMPVKLGKAGFVGVGHDEPWVEGALRRASFEGSMTIFTSIGEKAGLVLLDDPVRPDASRTLRGFRAQGIDRIVMLTGDRRPVAEAVGTALGIDGIYSDCTPEDKVAAARAEAHFGPTAMVGDGINDAPALAVADVGIAVASRGQSASSEAAGVVLTVDRIEPLVASLGIAHRSFRIATQSALAGVGLSLAAMLIAASGNLTPTWGAIAQEGIDLAVILNALRVLRVPRSKLSFSAETVELAEKLQAEHLQLRSGVDDMLALAGGLDLMNAEERLSGLRNCRMFLQQKVVPHERTENDVLYPALDQAMGLQGATSVMAREHAEIFSLARRLEMVEDDLASGAAGSGDVSEARQVLYGLHAILKLHFEQEEESYFSLGELAGTRGGRFQQPA